jgi:hypothetical protein
VCTQNSLALRNHIAVRNHLRTHRVWSNYSKLL